MTSEGIIIPPRVVDLELLPARIGFDQIRTGEVPPWLRYVHAVKAAHTTT